MKGSKKIQQQLDDLEEQMKKQRAIRKQLAAKLKAEQKLEEEEYIKKLGQCLHDALILDQKYQKLEFEKRFAFAKEQIMVLDVIDKQTQQAEQEEQKEESEFFR